MVGSYIQLADFLLSTLYSQLARCLPLPHIYSWLAFSPLHYIYSWLDFSCSTSYIQLTGFLPLYLIHTVGWISPVYIIYTVGWISPTYIIYIVGWLSPIYIIYTVGWISPPLPHIYSWLDFSCKECDNL